MSDKMPKGQSANPGGKDHMRRVQTVLNSKYSDEWYPIDVLDRARKTLDENGEPYTDRRIMAAALKALGEKFPDSFALPPVTHHEHIVPTDVIQHITDTVARQLDALLDSIVASNPGVGYFTSPDWVNQRTATRDSITTTVSDVVSTGNLTGESFKFEDDGEDDGWAS